MQSVKEFLVGVLAKVGLSGFKTVRPTHSMRNASLLRRIPATASRDSCLAFSQRAGFVEDVIRENQSGPRSPFLLHNSAPWLGLDRDGQLMRKDQRYPRTGQRP